MNLGASVTSDGVRYRVWAPKAHDMSVDVEAAGGGRVVPLEATEGGYFEGLDADGRAGDAYGFRIGGGSLLPDPASRGQRDDVHGRSLVVDPATYSWADADWKRPRFRDLVIYELHVGTFTAEGTYRSAIEKLAGLRELGVTAIEIMPVADFPGQRNWGYDGVLIYAPAQTYGSPDDLRALVDVAHAVGLAVILDVVYNHFGPDGNYLSAYGAGYFSKQHPTPWGDGFNFDGPESGPVREFFLGNPGYWMDEFHIDGFRFDATHEIQDSSQTHILAEMTASVHERGGYAIAEDPRNDVHLLDRKSGLGFDAVWADDFHHAARVSQTGDQHSYFADFSGSLGEVVRCLGHGWLYSGQLTRVQKVPRGTDSRSVPPEGFVHCLSNHDQTGNRAMGERIGALISPEAYRALSVVLCLNPCTPMLFMDQEWGAGSPFLFFCDHNPTLGRAVTEGRRREFSAFPEFSDPEKRRQIPDPQAIETFVRSKLNWEEIEADGPAALRRLYATCLSLRAEHAAFRPEGRMGWEARETNGAGVVWFEEAEGEFLLIFRLQGQGDVVPVEAGYELVLSSEEARFGGSGQSAWSADGGFGVGQAAEAVVLRRAR